MVATSILIMVGEVLKPDMGQGEIFLGGLGLKDVILQHNILLFLSQVKSCKIR
jgi:hypothetical protein